MPLVAKRREVDHQLQWEVCVIRGTKPGLFALIFAILLAIAGSARAPNPGGVQTGTGLTDVSKPRLAVADFAPREDPTKNHSQLFTQVVRDDLQFSGIIELVSPSFYPTQVPSVPGELKNLAWT